MPTICFSSSKWTRLISADEKTAVVRIYLLSGHGGHHDSPEAVYGRRAGAGGSCQEEGDGEYAI